MKAFNIMNRGVRGYSLVELLIAMALGLFLILGVAQIFIGTSNSSRGQTALAEVHESARYALHFLRQDLEIAGDKGCIMGNVGLVNKLNDANNTATNFWWNFSEEVNNWVLMRGIEGFEYDAGTNDWDRTPDARITDRLANSDILVVRGATGIAIPVKGSAGVNGNLDLHDNIHTLEKDDIVVATYDCLNSAIWQITNDPAGGTSVEYNACTATANTPCNNSLNTQMELDPAPSNDIYPELRKLSTRVYYVRENGSNVPSLYRVTNTDSAPQELVEGVERLNITYGVNSNNNEWETVKEYLAADEIEANGGDWGQVTSARIEMLVRSTMPNSASGRQNLRFDGQNVPFNDGFLRSTFELTVNLRGR
ncbi:PilW family protein [Aestuariirhabdus sp. Z084]|uniref:PilW family protein n=1 Tax=Aestuariirhabdus haliotis TaxID=2918751 RepID=UPI00201B3545|nr:PilW family protein [Aestuariirhabdus haliotis]MCL6416185.1 PilW family protein [Aestuariirhabdus haliotis]MCL6420237.1 PilW family protein [Aestuariirhabdus haliotis]